MEMADRGEGCLDRLVSVERTLSRWAGGDEVSACARNRDGGG